MGLTRRLFTEKKSLNLSFGFFVSEFKKINYFCIISNYSNYEFRDK